jgi:uncharacterized membrane-anchored protein YitT (DUF2179 family)
MKLIFKIVYKIFAGLGKFISRVYRFLANLWLKNGFKQITYIVLGSFIYSIAVVWFLELGQFFAGGVTGISQIITRLLGKHQIFISTGLLIAGLNLPLFILGWKGLSKRFAFYSLLSVILQSIFVGVLEYARDHYQINPLAISGIEDNILLLAILGAMIAAVGTSLCLKTGGSSGGMDIVSNYLLVKKNVPFVKYSFIVDFVIIAAAGILFDMPTAIYTIIRLIVYVLTLNEVYNTYRTMKIEIITTKHEEIRQELLKHFHHGITMYQATGGYTMQQKVVLEVLTSAYEVRPYIETVTKIDPSAFITVMIVTMLKGNFNKKTIV